MRALAIITPQLSEKTEPESPKPRPLIRVRSDSVLKQVRTLNHEIFPTAVSSSQIFQVSQPLVYTAPDLKNIPKNKENKDEDLITYIKLKFRVFTLINFIKYM